MIASALPSPLRAGLRRARGWVLSGRLAAELGPRAALAGAARRLRGPAAPFPAPEPAPSPGARFDAIYAIGYWDGEPKRYRVYNMAEGLREFGYRVHVMPFERLDDVRRHRWTATALVLFRAEEDPLAGIGPALAYARAHGMRVVYDVDDLVFDPELAERIDGLRLMGPYQRRRFIGALSRRRRLMQRCDLVTVSTEALAREAEKLGLPAAVVPNCLNGEQLRLAAALPPHTGGATVRVAYLSGSRTHRRDFRECEAALLMAMRRHRHLRFRIVGYLDLDPAWAEFGERIERVPFLPPAEMLRSVGECDINLAPLELGNPFCEGKSELKFFEAALVNVPTIASPTATLAAAIEDGVTGLLAGDENGWGRAFDALVTSAARRHAIGEAARQAALSRYTLRTVAPLAAAALGLPAPDAPHG